jgi:mannan endo-1,4-beta-mannosidase
MATLGDGSYSFLGAEGVDYVKNMGIGTLDCGTFHMHPGQWGYNYSWGNTWIKKRDAVGAKVGKPVVLEEYDARA